MSEQVVVAESSSASPPRWRDRLLAVLVVVGLYYAIQGACLLLRITRLFFSSDQLSGDLLWLELDEHHIWQLVFALILIRIYSQGNYSDWGLNLRNWKLSLRIFAWFAPAWLMIAFLTFALPMLLHHRAVEPGYPLSRTGIIGWLSFEGLLPGPSEELVFRGLIHTYLARTWKGVLRVGAVSMPTAGIIATLIFCLGHVNPFASPHINWGQQAYAFGLGVYFSAVYHRTGSLLNPMLAHNFGDFVIVGGWYLLYWRLG